MAHHKAGVRTYEQVKYSRLLLLCPGHTGQGASTVLVRCPASARPFLTGVHSPHGTLLVDLPRRRWHTLSS